MAQDYAHWWTLASSDVQIVLPKSYQDPDPKSSSHILKLQICQPWHACKIQEIDCKSSVLRCVIVHSFSSEV
jgi:hypothetical protein